MKLAQFSGGTPNKPVTPKKVKASFKANGKTVTKKLVPGKKYGKLPTAKKKGLYKFAGWYTKAKGGKKITAKSVVGKKSVKLYAHWKAKYGKVTGVSSVNVHKAASASSASKGYVTAKTKLRIVKKIDRPGTKWDWYKVSYKAKNGKKAYGYVDTDYVKTYWE